MGARRLSLRRPRPAPDPSFGWSVPRTGLSSGPGRRPGGSLTQDCSYWPAPGRPGLGRTASPEALRPAVGPRRPRPGQEDAGLRCSGCVCTREPLLLRVKAAVGPCLFPVAGLGHDGVVLCGVWLPGLRGMRMWDGCRKKLSLVLHHFQAHHFLSLGAAAFSCVSVFRDCPEARKRLGQGLPLHGAVAARRDPPVFLRLSSLILLLHCFGMQCFFRPLSVLATLPGPSLGLVTGLCVISVWPVSVPFPYLTLPPSWWALGPWFWDLPC